MTKKIRFHDFSNSEGESELLFILKLNEISKILFSSLNK